MAAGEPTIQQLQGQAFSQPAWNPPKVCPTCGTCPTCGSKHPKTGFMPNWPYQTTVLGSQQGNIQQSSPPQYENIN